VRPFAVVQHPPGLDLFSRIGEIAEVIDVEKRVTEPAVEAFDIAALHRLLSFDEVQAALGAGRPFHPVLAR
jgi:hypothetical protein